MHKHSLKSTLLCLFLPLLFLIMMFSSWLSFQELKTQVNQAFDRTLAGALRSIEVNIKTEHGGLSMEHPFYLFEFLELTTQSPVYFRIATADNLTEVGFALPMPDKQENISDKPFFYSTTYLGDNIRVAIMSVKPKQGLSYNPDMTLIIQVAERLQAREDFIQQMLWQSLGKDLLILLISALILSIVILLALRPLQHLSKTIAQRDTNDLRPISEQELPSEITPLVHAINSHISRYAHKSQLQRQFLDDTSHQLRTPLSVLNTQISYARNMTDKGSEMEEVLTAIQHRLNTTIELTNQLLTLAKVQDAADDAALHFKFEVFDLVDITQQAVNHLLPLARQKKMDYGMDMPEEAIWIQGIPWLVKEALSNLISNAIKYSPKHARITVSVKQYDDHVLFQVDDNGPGMSQHDIALAGKRFRRGSAGREQQGAGLGLAIVQTICEINHVELKLFSPSEGGLCAQLRFKPF